MAFEAALQLQQQGQEVSCVLLWIAPAMREAPGFVLGRTRPFRCFKQLCKFISSGAYSNLRRATPSLQLQHEYITESFGRSKTTYRRASLAAR